MSTTIHAMRRTLSVALLFAQLAGLAACGGGDDSGSTPIIPGSAPIPITPTPGTAASASNWSEQFDGVPNPATFFSIRYAALPSPRTTTPLYAMGGGSPSFASTTMTIGNARFTVGAFAATATTPTTTPGGMFTIVGKTCTLSATVTFTNATGQFQVYVDNNTVTAANSPHGASSLVLDVPVSSLVIGANTFLPFALTASGFAGGSFLQIRVDATGSVTFDNMSLNCV